MYLDDVQQAREAVAAAQAAKTAAEGEVVAAQADLLAAQKALQTADSNLAEAQNHLDDLLANPPEPVVPPGGMLYGYGHSNKAKLEADTKVLVVADRAYEQGVPGSQNDTVAKGMRAGGVPIISFKVADWAGTTPTGAVAKQFEAYLRSITRPTVVIFAHEPENDGRKPADFKKMGNVLLDVAKKVANPNVTMAINLMTSWLKKPVGQRSEDYIITGRTDYVLSWDGYTHDKTTTPATKFNPALALNKKYGLRFAISETANEVDAARWVEDVTKWCADNDAVWCCYWPSIVNEAGAKQYYPPATAFPRFAAVALRYGGTKM